MKYHGIDAQGTIEVERVTSIGNVTHRQANSPDVGRILYALDNQTLYYGNETGWVPWTPANDGAAGTSGTSGTSGMSVSAGGIYQLTDANMIPINWLNAQTQYITLIGVKTRTITFSNAVSGSVYKIPITQDGYGNRLISSWPSTIKWAGGSAPKLTTAADATDIVTLLCISTVLYYGDCRKNFR